MATYRDKLQWERHSNEKGWVLQCLKSEKKSCVKQYHANGTETWAKETIINKHDDGKPKNLFIHLSEGIFQIYNQPKISGLYCVYKGTNGQLYHSAISSNDKAALLSAMKSGGNLRDELLKIGKDPQFIF
ncbi:MULTISPECIES: hypothetical protein [Burkholderia cepacia complex]|uniref:hypothetical protein n=1 Tax=Burkholderia cepacia complex TaxID=87882 RepID=UPI0015940718|nr:MULTISPECIES: hypothetical protein [Burkholderia cepacia complex]MCO8403360.1 hypothetical protein [Burkholderia cenocepacia]MCO8417379.1 hypothetical protein [Burkholderia cenocepacia]